MGKKVPRNEWKSEWKSFRSKCVDCEGGQSSQQSFIIIFYKNCLLVCNDSTNSTNKNDKNSATSLTQCAPIQNAMESQMANAFGKSSLFTVKQRDAISIAFGRFSVHWTKLHTVVTSSAANKYCIVVATQEIQIWIRMQMTQKFMLKNDSKLFNIKWRRVVHLWWEYGDTHDLTNNFPLEMYFVTDGTIIICLFGFGAGLWGQRDAFEIYLVSSGKRWINQIIFYAYVQ